MPSASRLTRSVTIAWQDSSHRQADAVPSATARVAIAWRGLPLRQAPPAPSTPCFSRCRLADPALLSGAITILVQYWFGSGILRTIPTDLFFIQFLSYLSAKYHILNEYIQLFPYATLPRKLFSAERLPRSLGVIHVLPNQYPSCG